MMIVNMITRHAVASHLIPGGKGPMGILPAIASSSGLLAAVSTGGAGDGSSAVSVSRKNTFSPLFARCKSTSQQLWLDSRNDAFSGRKTRTGRSTAAAASKNDPRSRDLVRSFLAYYKQ